MDRRVIRVTAATAVAAFVLTACGQKPGVHVNGGGLPLAAPGDLGGDTGDRAEALGLDGGSEGGSPAAGDEPWGAEDQGGGAVATDATGGATTATGGAEPGDPGGSTAGSQDVAGEGTSPRTSSDPVPAPKPPPATAKLTPKGTDRTGAGPDEIVFASHAPVTGAAPLPTTSFEKSGDLYWRDLTERRGEDVLGRSAVRLIFRDDKYDPSSARQVCRELEAEAFALSGGGGTDQIQACGQFAAVAKFPYFSAGVTEAGLRGNAWYFASSMSYKQQGRLLAQYIVRNPDGIETLEGSPKVAAIVTDTPNFDDAVKGWEAGVAEFGVDYHRTLRHPKGDTSWYSDYARDLKAAGVDVIYILSSPVDYIRLAQKADEQGYHPQYVGVGLSMGLNAVLGSGCPWVDHGVFFSPFPGLDHGRKHVKAFFDAAAHFGAPDDDIALALWGMNAVMHELLLRYQAAFGDDLTREDFRVLVENSRDVRTSVFPSLSYSPQDHFGAKQVHVLQASCEESGGPDEYVTLRTFTSEF